MTTTNKRDFLDLSELSANDLRSILDDAYAMKSRYKKGIQADDLPLKGKVLAMIFMQNSTRTRMSFDLAMRQLGGETMLLLGSDMQLGRGEPMSDTAQVMSRYVDAIMIRMHAHDQITELARHASIPVINGLSQRSHPCQLLADIMTLEEHLGTIEGKKVSWFGDGNNVLHSWIEAATFFDFKLAIAVPDDAMPDKKILSQALERGADIEISKDVNDAARGADCILTDTWISMGEDGADVHNKFAPYQVNDQIMQQANSEAIFMHCLPAYREKEVTTSVIDGPQSVIFDEAENRLHAQKAVLKWCLNV